MRKFKVETRISQDFTGTGLASSVSSGGFLSLNPDAMALPCSRPGASLSPLLRQELLALGST